MGLYTPPTLILPTSMLIKRNYECSRCSFRFFKVGPSRVEKCPKCTNVVYDKTLRKGETLDQYSASKERWYKNEGQHIEEIKRRKVVNVGGSEVVANTDSKGRIIDYIPTYDVKKTIMGTKKAEGRI